jgi:2-keto-3-deoxy-L-rhamnonate aldolase RhmA
MERSQASYDSDMKHGQISSLRQRLLDGEVILAGWLQLPSSDVAEIIASSAVDVVVVDQEHGAIGRREMANLVRVIDGCGKYPFVRLMSQDVHLGRQALDAGSVGLIVPHVESVESFLEFVSGCTFPPLGNRSMGYFRANGYGSEFDSHLESASRPILIPMIESQAGISIVNKLIALVEPEAVLIGPYDLSASLGDPGNFSSSSYVNAFQSVLKACHGSKTKAGIHDVSGEWSSVEAQIALGFSFIGCATDSLFLAKGIRSAIAGRT